MMTPTIVIIHQSHIVLYQTIVTHKDRFHIISKSFFQFFHEHIPTFSYLLTPLFCQWARAQLALASPLLNFEHPLCRERRKKKKKWVHSSNMCKAKRKNLNSMEELITPFPSTEIQDLSTLLQFKRPLSV
jgi:hypothetical protein